MKKTLLLACSFLFIGAASAFAQTELQAKQKCRTLGTTPSVFMTNRLAAIDEGAQSPEGEMKVILAEDFSKFPAATVENPVDVPTDEYGTISTDYVHAEGWQGVPIRSVGGAALIDLNPNGETGLLFTPNLTNLYGGTLTMRVKLLAPAGTTDVFFVEYNDGDLYSNISYSQTEVSADDWATVIMPLSAYAYNVYLCFYTASHPVIIDDIEVQALRPFIDAPVAQPFTNYTGTSFNAHWSEVEGATAYLLTVYSIGADGQPVYLLEDKEVTGTNFVVTGLDPELIYYYYVKAKNDKHVSAQSQAIKIDALISPVFHEPVPAEGGYTITWDAVDGADFYDFWAYRRHTAKEDGVVTVIDQNFSTVESDGTLAAPEVSGELYNYVPELPGWILWGAAYVNGAIGLNGAASADGMPCYLESPTFDLSGAAGISIEGEFAAGTPGETLMVYFLDAKGDEYIVDSYYYIENLNENWRKYGITPGGFSPNTKILIAPTGAGCSFIDNLKITVYLPQGQHFDIPILNAVTNDPVATVPASDPNATYACKVRAIGQSKGGEGLAYSGFTDLLFFGNTTSIETVATAKPNISLSGSTLSVTGAASPVVVHTLGGQLLGRESASAASFTLPARGIYLVTVGGQTTKIVY